MYYTEIKHGGHLRTRAKCRKHRLQASLFYISGVNSSCLSPITSKRFSGRNKILRREFGFNSRDNV